MIKAENIAAGFVIPAQARKFAFYARENNAQSAVDVGRLLKDYEGSDYYIVRQRLAEVLARELSSEIEPEVYPSNGYEDKSLKYQDKLNTGSVLLLENPTERLVRFAKIKDMPIDIIKIDVSHTFPDGKAYIMRHRNIGKTILPRITSAINFYEEQIQRQAKLTTKRDINLFEMDLDARREIVGEAYGNIIAYLLSNADERLFWGELTPAQKKLYLLSVISSQKKDLETRNNVINNIAGYTTLPELEKVSKHNYRALRRFIVK